jgi:MFS family permease
MQGPPGRLWPDDLRGRAFWVVLGCLVCQMGLGYGYVFGPLARDLLDEFGWSRAEYSAARIPQLAVMAAASPLLGILTVRFGARPILIASTALLGIAFAGVSGISSLWQLYALIMLQGLVVTGLGDISVGQMVSRWATRSRGLALGIVYTGSNLGGALMTRLAAWLADHESWRTAFAATPEHYCRASWSPPPFTRCACWAWPGATRSWRASCRAWRGAQACGPCPTSRARRARER